MPLFSLPYPRSSAFSDSAAERPDATCPARRPTMLALAGCAILALTGGCSTLPQAGPVGRAITNEAADGTFSLVEVDHAEALPPPPEIPQFQPLPPGWDAQAARIAPGDFITVTVYEVGVSLFSAAASDADTPFDPTAKGAEIGPIEVNREGTVRLPYIGTVEASGQTVAQLAETIESRMRGMSENPQVMVRIDAANGSGVMVSGEIANPGRVRLSAAQEKLLDVISLAGGNRGGTADLLVHVERGGVVSEGPFEAMRYSNFGGTLMEPGDKVELVRVPRSFSVLGSANRINRYDLPLRQFSLIEALAMAGGANENVADPGAVFVFRFETTGTDGAERPVVYHFNMLEPVSYFLAQQFYMTDDDVLYVAGAEANQPGKLLQMIGQVFTPIIIARQVTD